MTHECDKVGMEYFDSAPMRFPASEEIGVSAQRLFEIFLDAESWTKWVTAITNVEWTSPFPLEVGSTRSVTMLGGMVGHEEFLAWDAPHHMAFRFNSASMGGVSAFAEDYRVTEIGEDRCRIDWVLTMTPAGISRYTMPVVKPVMAAFARRTMRELRKYAESDPVLSSESAESAEQGAS